MRIIASLPTYCVITTHSLWVQTRGVGERKERKISKFATVANLAINVEGSAIDLQCHEMQSITKDKSNGHSGQITNLISDGAFVSRTVNYHIHREDGTISKFINFFLLTNYYNISVQSHLSVTRTLLYQWPLTSRTSKIKCRSDTNEIIVEPSALGTPS